MSWEISRGDWMSHPTRVISRLDIKGPNLVKGLQFEGNRVLGTAQQFAEIYYHEGADELIYQDVVASLYKRNSLKEIVKRTSETMAIPLTVAGGIRTIEDVNGLLRAGADKVAINTAATADPTFLTEAARVFGSQCIVASIESYRQLDGSCEVWTDYGREVTDLKTLEWAQRVEELGVGEILLTSINNEGMGTGFDTEIIEAISSSVSIPVIACGGAGSLEHFRDAVTLGKADAVAAASVFHYHYCQPVNQPNMSYSSPELRMGAQIDSGNIEFLNEGYGGETDLMVEPLSITAVKKYLNDSGIETRTI